MTIEELKELIDKVGKDNLPLNVFTIEDDDPYVLLGKMLIIEKALKEYHNIATENIEKSNEAINKADEAIETANRAVSGIGSNPNLLINGDFRVNQRGQNSYSGSGTTHYNYTVDRWRVIGTASVGVSSSGLDCVLTSRYANVSYVFEDNDSAKLVGKQVTLSFNIENLIGTLTIKIRQSGTNIVAKDFTTNGLQYMTITLPNSLTNFDIHFENNATTELSFKLNWAKLELGSVATPLSPRPYSEELAMCQRYYQVFNSQTLRCDLYNPTQVIFTLPIPVTLRNYQTLSIGEGSGIQAISGGAISTNWNFSVQTPVCNNCLKIRAVAPSGVTPTDCLLNFQNITSIDAEMY